jgi:hypothetical protein
MWKAALKRQINEEKYIRHGKEKSTRLRKFYEEEDEEREGGEI